MNSERGDDVRRLLTLLFMMRVLLLAACPSDEKGKAENQFSIESSFFVIECLQFVIDASELSIESK